MNNDDVLLFCKKHKIDFYEKIEAIKNNLTPETMTGDYFADKHALVDNFKIYCFT